MTRKEAITQSLSSGATPHPVAGVRLTVWFDGACPLCTREIALFRKMDTRGAIRFEDVSAPGASCPMDQARLLERFHAQETGKPVVSGAAAFAAMWRAIPVLRPLGKIAQVPPVLWALERVYILFLKIRPRLQKWVKPKAAD